MTVVATTTKTRDPIIIQVMCRARLGTRAHWGIPRRERVETSENQFRGVLRTQRSLFIARRLENWMEQVLWPGHLDRFDFKWLESQANTVRVALNSLDGAFHEIRFLHLHHREAKVNAGGCGGMAGFV